MAAKLALADRPDAVVTYIDTGSEHADNERFISECETWFGHAVERLRSDRYADTWDVWERTRYLVGPTGARCTGELKKRVRFAYQRTDDLQVFGFTADPREVTRAARFREQNVEVDLWAPLIDRGLTKTDCLGLLAAAGIEIPAMYRLGYDNNNCVGCVKGGQAYWNRIRQDFPEVFARMAALEQDIGATVLRSKGQPLPLIALDPRAGRGSPPRAIECSPLCSGVLGEIES